MRLPVSDCPHITVTPVGVPKSQAGASAIFFLDTEGKVIISRNYRGEVPMTVTETFVQHVVNADEVGLYLVKYHSVKRHLVRPHLVKRHLVRL